MNLNDLIEQKGEEILGQSTLHLGWGNKHYDSGVFGDLEGINRFTNIKEIHFLDDDFENKKLLTSGVLKNSVEEIHLYRDIKDMRSLLSLISDYDLVDKLLIHSCDLTDIGPNLGRLSETAKSLFLFSCQGDYAQLVPKFKQLEFLSIHFREYEPDYTTVENLEKAVEASNLSSEHKKQTKTYLTILRTLITSMEREYLDLSFIKGCPELKRVHLKEPLGLKGIDYSVFEGSHFKRLEELCIWNSFDLRDISFLSDYQLKSIGLTACSLIEDYSPLKSTSLEKNVEELELNGSIAIPTKFDDFSLLRNYQKLRKLNLFGTSVRNLPPDFLDYEFVRNGSLKELTLSASIRWEDSQNGAMVQKLRKKGINVDVPTNFWYDSEAGFHSKIYVISGPSAGGKSTLINNLTKKYTWVKCIPKVTTRPPRIGEKDDHSIEHISLKEFEYLEEEGKIAYSSFYKGYNYGIRLTNLIEAYSSSQVYLLDWGEPASALQLRDKLSQKGFPNLMSLILLLTPKELIARGFLKRLTTNSFGQVALDTKERFDDLTVNFDRISSYIDKGVNAVVMSESYETAEDKIIDLIRGRSKLTK